MRFIGRRFVVVALAALAASSMVAASEPEFFDSVFVQTWKFHDRAEGPGSCSVTLLMDGGAMASEDCAGSYPVLSDLSAWRPLSTSALELRNDGGAFLRFSSVSPDELEATDGARTYVLGVEVVSDEQYSDEGAATLGGAYTLSAAGSGAKTCAIVLATTGGDGVFGIEFGEGCATSFPFVEGVSGWQPDGTEVIRLLDAEGGSRMTFAFTGDGVTFDATEPLDGVSYRLVRPRDEE